MNNRKLKENVRRSAALLIRKKGYISPFDMLMELDYLSLKDYEDWRKNKIPYLEKACQTNLSKLSIIMKELKQYATEKNLKSSWTAYHKWGKGSKIELQFSKTGKEEIEKAYATHYVGLKE